MPFLSAGSSYVAVDSLEKSWSRKVLGLNGGGDREGSFRKFDINYQSVQTRKSRFFRIFVSFAKGDVQLQLTSQ